MSKVKQWAIWILINILLLALVTLFFCFLAHLKKQELEDYHKQRMSEEQQTTTPELIIEENTLGGSNAK